MHRLVETFNRALTAPFELLFRLLAPLPDLLSLTLLSVAAGVLMVWIFGRVSDQEGIRETKERIQAELIAVRLFQSSAGVFLRTQGRVAVRTLNYIRLSLKPILVMILPVLALIIQLHARYGLRPLNVGEAALVTSVVADPGSLAAPDGVLLEAGPGLKVETPGVRIPSRKEISWRIRPQEEGIHTLTLRVADAEVSKRVIVGGSRGILTAVRTARSIPEGLLHPGEKLIEADAPLRSVRISYTGRGLDILGWEVHWLLYFFVISVASGYMLKGIMGVEL